MTGTSGVVRPHLALLGIGAMGYPMAKRLLSADHHLTVWNRTAEKAEVLSEFGAEVAREPSTAVDGADVVILMLESGPVVDHVLFNRGVAGAMDGGAILIDMSSTSPGLARQHADRLGDTGLGYLDAPVSGGTSGALRGDLAIFVGGDPEPVKRCWPILEVLGAPTHLGGAGAGQAAKLINQVIVGIGIGAVVEGLSLGRALGVNLEAVHKALKGGFADSRILREHGDRILAGEFEPGAAIRIQIKDMHNAIEAAGEATLRLPVSQQVLDEYEAMASRGQGELDHSALWLWYQAQNRGSVD